MAAVIAANDRIDKLNSNNYRSWKYNIKMTLIQRELWDHVTREATRPTNAAEIERFNRMKEKALAAIALSIEPEQQGHIMDCSTAFEAWEALRKIFEPRSRPRILQLKKQIVSIQLESEESMTSYLNRLKTCSDSLKEAGHEVRDDDLVYAMLSGLPESYEGIIMSLANLDETKFTSSEIKGILLTESERRSVKGTNIASKQKEAYHQVKVTPRRTTEFKKEERKCLKCGKPRHIAINCRVQHPKANYKNSVPYTSKQKDSYLLEINNVQSDNFWLIDSGATHHVCKYRQWFNNYKEINREKIYSADSSADNNLKAIGIGDIEVETYVIVNVISYNHINMNT